MLGRLTFPRFDKTVRVLAGFDQETIDRGPGWYPRSRLPGEGRVIYIAGHRRTRGGPFRELGALQLSDEVVFEVPYAIARYTVIQKGRVQERELSILGPGLSESEQLRLQASTIPPGRERLIVVARLKSIRPVPAD